MSIKVLKKIIIILFICIILWVIIPKKNHIKLTETSNTKSIPRSATQSITISEKAVILYDPHQNNNKTSTDRVNYQPIQTRSYISDDLRKNFSFNNLGIAGEYNSNYNQKETHSSPDAIWNSRKFLITATNKYHSTVNNTEDSINESKQAKSENEGVIKNEINKVHCPSVRHIQQMAKKINQAFFVNDVYTVISYDPAFQDSNIDWLIGVVSVTANSSDEAIYKAKIIASQASIRKKEYAEKIDKSFSNDGLFDIFICSYGPDDIRTIGVRDEVLIDK